MPISKTGLLQTIHFNISTLFSSVWPIDKTLSGATTPGRVDLGVMAMKGTSYSAKLQDYWGLTIRLFRVISGYSLGCLAPLQRRSQCILPNPLPTGQSLYYCQILSIYYYVVIFSLYHFIIIFTPIYIYHYIVRFSLVYIIIYSHYFIYHYIVTVSLFILI